MGKQGKQNKRTENNNIGKGQVTQVQVAFIVDRYLYDNNFQQTRSAFRLEASSLLSKSPVQEAPKSLLTLMEMLNEYVSLKEKKVIIDQEKFRLDQEKLRVQTLFQGMQAAMNAYNAGETAAVPVIPASSTPLSASLAGCPPCQTPTITPASLPSKNVFNSGKFSSVATRKRKGIRNNSEDRSVTKRAHSSTDSRLSSNAGVTWNPQLPHSANGKESLQPTPAPTYPPYGDGSNCSEIQGSRVAKCLFNQAVSSPPSASPSPKTPPQGTSSPSDKCTSVLQSSSPANRNNNYNPQDITPTHCTVISSQTVTVSPCKQGTIYSVQRNQIITSSPLKANMKRASTRDHVKGRLNFDTSDAITGSDQGVLEVSTSESEKEVDFFDTDFPNLDALGPNFSFSDLLEFDFDCGDIEFNGQSNIGSSPDNVSGSSNDMGDFDNGAGQAMLSNLSTETDVPEKGSIVEGSETLTTMNAVTKRIQVLSPAKKCSSLHQNSQRDPQVKN